MRAVCLVSCLLLASILAALSIAAPAATGREPSEAQMRAAFEDILTRQVRNALDFAAETGGPEAVAAIREKGFDRFRIVAFRKRACRHLAEGGSHVCEFSVDIEVVSGRMEHVIAGRFVAQPDRLVFVGDV